MESASAGKYLIQMLPETHRFPIITSRDTVVGEASLHSAYIFLSTPYPMKWGTLHLLPLIASKYCPIRQPTAYPVPDVVRWNCEGMVRLVVRLRDGHNPSRGQKEPLMFRQVGIGGTLRLPGYGHFCAGRECYNIGGQGPTNQFINYTRPGHLESRNWWRSAYLPWWALSRN